MKPGDPIKLISQLIDLPILDKDERWCGIVDDIELEGSAGNETRIRALLVGPGAYEGRLPAWAFWLVRMIVGDSLARVPLDEIESITSAVRLKCSAEEIKLHAVEDKVRAWIPRWGAM